MDVIKPLPLDIEVCKVFSVAGAIAQYHAAILRVPARKNCQVMARLTRFRISGIGFAESPNKGVHLFRVAAAGRATQRRRGY
jgi:hypothetical protein